MLPWQGLGLCRGSSDPQTGCEAHTGGAKGGKALVSGESPHRRCGLSESCSVQA